MHRIAILLCICICIVIYPGIAQKIAEVKLEQIAGSAETDFALSALPPNLRAGATIYLLDIAKGYYIARTVTNHFISFVARTEWECGEFRKDLATPMSFDAGGARTFFRVYVDLSALRHQENLRLFRSKTP